MMRAVNEVDVVLANNARVTLRVGEMLDDLLTGTCPVIVVVNASGPNVDSGQLDLQHLHDMLTVLHGPSTAEAHSISS